MYSDCRLEGRVQRGPDWIWDDQDNDNLFGTVRGPPKTQSLIRRGGITISETRKGWCTVRRDGKTTFIDYRTTSLCTTTGLDDDWSINWVDIVWTVFALVCELWVARSIMYRSIEQKKIGKVGA